MQDILSQTVFTAILAVLPIKRHAANNLLQSDTFAFLND